MALLGYNYTQLPALVYEHRFYRGEPWDCLVMKSTFAFKPDGTIKPLATQPDLVCDDTWRDQPLASDLLYQNDLTPYKPGTDVVLVGHARPRGGKPTSAWGARLVIEDKLDKTLHCHGPRFWRYSVVDGWHLDEGEPTDAVLLSWANAYGGIVGSGEKPEELFEHNPLGCGFLGPDGPDRKQTYKAPQLTYPDDPVTVIDRPIRPAGFMPMPNHFWDRLELAGTYDEAWGREMAPHIPLDMDLAFWQGAPRDQIVKPYLRGDETIRLIGLLPEGEVSLRLPDYELGALLEDHDGNADKYPLHLDTVLIDLDRRRLTLRWAALAGRGNGHFRANLIAGNVNV